MTAHQCYRYAGDSRRSEKTWLSINIRKVSSREGVDDALKSICYTNQKKFSQPIKFSRIR